MWSNQSPIISLNVSKLVSASCRCYFFNQVLVVITDTTTGPDKPAIEKAAKDLIEGAIVVIPVAIGNKPVPDLEKEFPDEDIIKTNVTDHPIKTADKIQEKLEDGNVFVQSNYRDFFHETSRQPYSIAVITIELAIIYSFVKKVCERGKRMNASVNTMQIDPLASFVCQPAENSNRLKTVVTQNEKRVSKVE